MITSYPREAVSADDSGANLTSRQWSTILAPLDGWDTGLTLNAPSNSSTAASVTAGRAALNGFVVEVDAAGAALNAPLAVGTYYVAVTMDLAKAPTSATGTGALTIEVLTAASPALPGSLPLWQIDRLGTSTTVTDLRGARGLHLVKARAQGLPPAAAFPGGAVVVDGEGYPYGLAPGSAAWSPGPAFATWGAGPAVTIAANQEVGISPGAMDAASIGFAGLAVPSSGVYDVCLEFDSDSGGGLVDRRVSVIIGNAPELRERVPGVDSGYVGGGLVQSSVSAPRRLTKGAAIVVKASPTNGNAAFNVRRLTLIRRPGY